MASPPPGDARLAAPVERGADDAVAEAQAGLALAEEIGTRLHAEVLYGFLELVAVHRDDLPAAEALMAEMRQEFLAGAGDAWSTAAEHDLRAAGPRWPLEWGLWLGALLLEAKGETAEALAALEHAWALSAPLRYLVSCRHLVARPRAPGTGRRQP